SRFAGVAEAWVDVHAAKRRARDGARFVRGEVRGRRCAAREEDAENEGSRHGPPNSKARARAKLADPLRSRIAIEPSARADHARDRRDQAVIRRRALLCTNPLMRWAPHWPV